jgi:hypothetical protein
MSCGRECLRAADGGHKQAPGEAPEPPSPLEEAVPAAAPQPGWRCQVALGVSNELHHA